MKKPKRDRDDEIKLTQIEIDLGNHLKDRIYQVLNDFRDTAEIGGIPVQKITGILIATLLDAAMAGIVSLRLPPEGIEQVINARLQMAFDEHAKHRKGRS